MIRKQKYRLGGIFVLVVWATSG